MTPRRLRLFTPGPLSTSEYVKRAMECDCGSRSAELVGCVRRIRARLLEVAGASEEHYQAVLVQGSGTYAVEASLSLLSPPDARWLVASNGLYGDRIHAIAEALGLRSTRMTGPVDRPLDPARVKRELRRTGATHLAIVHCETTTGLLNPVTEIATGAARRDVRVLVDAMSSFGGVPFTLGESGIDCLVSSPNKCLQGVPGFAFALATRTALLEGRGRSRSLALDLHAQWRRLEEDGQFRFTPPVHALLAFERALDELAAEGGVEARARRYRKNCRLLLEGMAHLGFEPVLAPANCAHIINAFHEPAHDGFEFVQFAERLAERGAVIYPGDLPGLRCFRIGTIGALHPEDVSCLLSDLAAVLTDMGIRPPLLSPARRPGG